MRRFSWQEYADSVAAGKPLKVVDGNGDEAKQLICFTGLSEFEDKQPVYGVVSGQVECWTKEGIWNIHGTSLGRKRNIKFAEVQV